MKISTESNIISKKNVFISLLASVITIVCLIINNTYNKNRNCKSKTGRNKRGLFIKLFVSAFKLLSSVFSHAGVKKAVKDIDTGSPVKIEKSIMINI